MKCKCSLNNNYEVIGLCDIGKYNKKISGFKDKSWTQTSIPEKLILKSNKPPIKEVIKLYLNIKVTESRIVKTPSSEVPNVEGLILTGKVLLVSGEICQRIMYVSKTHNESLCSVKFAVKFSTYIVIDENADLENDAYCVYPYVEDISIRKLDERILSKSVTLFLFAHKTTTTPLPPPKVEKLPNFFVFKTLDVGEELATIEFDVTNMKLIVGSTGFYYGNNPGETAFEVSLLNSNGDVKASASIGSNQNADNFKNDLNSQSFKFTDSIEIKYLNSSKVDLGNYPDLNDTYNMSITNLSEKFKITQDEITPILTPNKITVKSQGNEEVLNIKFALEREIFIVSSKGVIPDPTSSEAYLTLILKDENGNELIKATLNSDEDGSSFKEKVNFKSFSSSNTSLNLKSFNYSNTTLTLIYKDKSKIEISNYPRMGETYIPTEDVNNFSIGSGDLKELTTNNKIKIINENNEEMSDIYFIMSNSSPIINITATSTPVIATNSGNPSEKYVEFLQYSVSRPMFYGEILKRENAKNFASNLNNNAINSSTTNFLKLSNRIRDKIIITNYKGESEYKIGEEPEFLEIKRDSLVPHSLGYNKIRLKNRDNSSVFYIYFHRVDRDIIYMMPYSTGIINKDTTSFLFTITHSFGENAVIRNTINQGENGDVININPPYNISQDFKIGFLLILQYSDNSLVEVFDFPFTNPAYNPPLGSNTQAFRITENGLSSVEILSIYSIEFNGSNNSPIAILGFDPSRKTLRVFSTGDIPNPSLGGQEYFALALKDSNGVVKNEALVRGNENATSFRNTLDNTTFSYGDIITLRFKQHDKVNVFNYPNIGDIFNPPSLSDTYNFKITQNGLEEFEIPKFLSYFRFKSQNNLDIAKIELDRFNMVLEVTSTGIPYGDNPGQTAFIVSLLNSNGDVKISASIKSNENADDFKNILNSQSFEFTDTIAINYLDFSKVDLVNYPDLNDTYNMSSANREEEFKITQDGITPILTPNKIIVKSESNEDVLTIQFDLEKQIFIVSSKGVVPDISSSESYLRFILKDEHGNDLIKAILNSNEDGSSFKEKVNFKSFNYGRNSLSFVYKNKSKIEILNYPTMGETYTPTEDVNSFLIEPNNLRDLSFDNKVKILNEDEEEMATLYFIKAFNNPIIKAIGRITSLMSTFMGKKTKKYIQFLFYSEDDFRFYAEILEEETAERFVNEVENAIFNIQSNSFLRLSNKVNETIIITNYKGKGEYIITEEPEFLNVNRNSFSPHSLNYNKIRFKNFTWRNILYIYFHKLSDGTFYIEPYSTGAINYDAEYLTFKITDSTGRDIKLQGRINKGETGDVISIEPPFNISKNFNIGDLFTIAYSFSKLAQIYDPPFTNPPRYATGTSETFILGRDEFEKIPPVKFKTTFEFKTYDREETMAIVEFDTANKKLIVTSLGNTCNAPVQEGVFSFSLINSVDETTRVGSIYGSGNANSFRDELNGLNFNYSDVIRLIFAPRPKVVLTNYPNQGDIYNMVSHDDQTFKITSIGVIPNVLKNIITVNDFDNNSLVTIEFDAYWKTFLIISTGRKAPVTSKVYYFTMTLYDSNGTTQIVSANIGGGNNANSLETLFNNRQIKNGNFLNIIYRPDTVVITNYPDEGTPSYNPPGTEKRFKFIENGFE